MNIYRSRYSFLKGFSSIEEIASIGERVILSDIGSFFGMYEFLKTSKDGIFAPAIIFQGGKEMMFFPTCTEELNTITRIISILNEDPKVKPSYLFMDHNNMPPCVYEEGIDANIPKSIGKKAFSMSALDIDMINAVSNEKRHLASLLGVGKVYKKDPNKREIDRFRELLTPLNRIIDIGSRMIPSIHDNADSILYLICRKRLKKIETGETSKYEKRLRYEFNIIRSKGLSDYFLIVHDMMEYAKKENIPVGPARGSAASSLIVFLLGITSVDPIEKGLFFERFLNPQRSELPDIDIDFSYTKRYKVFCYLESKYPEAAGHLSTVVKFSWRGAMRYLARALNWKNDHVNGILRLLPMYFNGGIDKLFEFHPAIKRCCKNDEITSYYLSITSELVDTPYTYSVHPSGFFVLDRPVFNVSPLHRSGNGEKIAHITKDTPLDIVKIDCLGLRYLNVINETEKDAENDGYKVIINDDTNVYSMISRGETTGVFQLESSGIKTYLRKLKPENIEDMTAIVSLYRPGPLNGGIVNDYIKRRHAPETVEFPVNELSEILSISYGFILFQEQVMEIAVKIAGLSWELANTMRKAMSKRDHRIMSKLKDIFLCGCIKNNIGRQKAVRIWGFLEKFASYGFARSHAVGYGILAYRSAFLKYHFPLYYCKNLLNAFIDSPGDVQKYLLEALRNGMNILTPDINKSRAGFSVSGGNIICGFLSIKGISQKWADKLVMVNDMFDLPHPSFEEYLERAYQLGIIFPVNVMLHLIQAGCFYTYGDREALINHFLKKVHNTLFSCNDLKYDPNSQHTYNPEFLKVLLHLPLSFEKKGNRFKISGFITESRKVMTKTGKFMFFITISNEKHRFDCIMFPNVAGRFMENHIDGHPVEINGYHNIVGSYLDI